MSDHGKETRMETMLAAFTDLVTDTGVLYDPEQEGEPHAAVYVDLTRDNDGRFYINVSTKQISGAQLAFVLDVARRYELDVYEQERYLILDRHLTSVDVPEDEREPEAVGA